MSVATKSAGPDASPAACVGTSLSPAPPSVIHQLRQLRGLLFSRYLYTAAGRLSDDDGGGGVDRGTEEELVCALQPQLYGAVLKDLVSCDAFLLSFAHRVACTSLCRDHAGGDRDASRMAAARAAVIASSLLPRQSLFSKAGTLSLAARFIGNPDVSQASSADESNADVAVSSSWPLVVAAFPADTISASLRGALDDIAAAVWPKEAAADGYTPVSVVPSATDAAGRAAKLCKAASALVTALGQQLDSPGSRAAVTPSMASCFAFAFMLLVAALRGCFVALTSAVAKGGNAASSSLLSSVSSTLQLLLSFAEKGDALWLRGPGDHETIGDDSAHAASASRIPIFLPSYHAGSLLAVWTRDVDTSDPSANATLKSVVTDSLRKVREGDQTCARNGKRTRGHDGHAPDRVTSQSAACCRTRFADSLSWGPADRRQSNDSSAAAPAALAEETPTVSEREAADAATSLDAAALELGASGTAASIRDIDLLIRAQRHLMWTPWTVMQSAAEPSSAAWSGRAWIERLYLCRPSAASPSANGGGAANGAVVRSFPHGATSFFPASSDVHDVLLSSDGGRSAQMASVDLTGLEHCIATTVPRGA